MHTKIIFTMLCLVPLTIFSMEDEPKKIASQSDIDTQLILDSFYKSRQKALNKKGNSAYKVNVNKCSGDTPSIIARRVGIVPSSYAQNDWRAKL